MKIKILKFLKNTKKKINKVQNIVRIMLQGKNYNKCMIKQLKTLFDK